MLKLIMEELKQNKIDEKQFININFWKFGKIEN